jgi:hypothetical protein
MEKDSEATHVTEFFGMVDNGDESAEMWRERFDGLEFASTSDSPESLVTINRTNEEEAKAVEKLIREYRDVFAIEVRPQPALVAPIELKVDDELWNNTVSRT